MCKREPRLVLVLLLIGSKIDARTLSQSLSEVMQKQNQSNLLITFDTQLETALSNNRNSYGSPVSLKL